MTPVDPLGILPPVIRSNYELDEAMDHMRKASGALAKALRDYDDRLTLQYFEENCRPRNVVIGRVIPGRWHIVRRNDFPAPDIPYPIVSREDGHSFREPDFGDLIDMQKRDLQKLDDPVPKDKPEENPDDSMNEEVASDIRAYGRLTGDGGITRRVRGKGK